MITLLPTKQGSRSHQHQLPNLGVPYGCHIHMHIFAQIHAQLGVKALDLTGEGSGEINNIDKDISEDVPGLSSFHAF